MGSLNLHPTYEPMSSSTSSINSVWSMEGLEGDSGSDDESVMTSMGNELKTPKLQEGPLEKQANTPIIIISAA